MHHRANVQGLVVVEYADFGRLTGLATFDWLLLAEFRDGLRHTPDFFVKKAVKPDVHVCGYPECLYAGSGAGGDIIVLCNAG